MLTAFFLLMVTPLLGNQLEAFLPEALVTNILRGTVFLFWYMTGCFAGSVVRAIANLRSWTLFGAAVGFYGVMAYAVYVKNVGISLGFPLSIMGIVGVLLGASWASKFSCVRAASAYIAARTLPIYVVHPIVLNVVIAVSVAIGEGSTVLPSDSDVLNAVIVPGIVALSISVAVVLFDVTANTPFRWIFQFPTELFRRERQGASQ